MRGQNHFNLEELLQIFSAANLNASTQRRRPPKGNLYAGLHDAVNLGQKPAMGLFQHNTFKIRPEFLGFSTAFGKPLKLETTAQPEEAALMVKASAKVTPTSKTSTLQKVDYLEYLEQTGESVINMFLRHSGKIKHLTSDLRKRLSEKNPDFSNLDNDSWRKVNYLSPQQ